MTTKKPASRKFSGRKADGFRHVAIAYLRQTGFVCLFVVATFSLANRASAQFQQPGFNTGSTVAPLGAAPARTATPAAPQFGAGVTPSIPSAAQPEVVAESETDTEAGGVSSYVPSWMSSLKSKLLDGGPLMIPLGICFLAVFVLTLERFLAMRRKRVIPRPFVRRFREKIEDGQLDYDEAVELCTEFDCPVADVFAAAVKRTGRPAVEIEAAVVDAIERTADRLRRNLRVFHAISNVAPLLGLLGTVLGMIEAFNTMAAQSGIGRPEMLASGISQALVTTAGGLCVAIPAYLAYMYFSSRADRYLSEIESLSLSVIDGVSAESSQASGKSRRRRAA